MLNRLKPQKQIIGKDTLKRILFYFSLLPSDRTTCGAD
ncbi:hypothetical protein CHCC20488_2534 [Bacillus paralicheniformis]|nr:hypothetical protein CHCC14523_2638 [Bacillus paralicheniformis]TWN79087.1 hypothetical protein CHCC20492_1551 [Bacillus paralicheniformis]TWO02378.1 hypothetical protein CHCC20488_2534 [Bacillus paralicheniformis]